jgi:mitochondrial fission protein ELM1
MVWTSSITNHKLFHHMLNELKVVAMLWTSSITNHKFFHHTLNELKVVAMLWTSITNHKLCHTPLNELKVAAMVWTSSITNHKLFHHMLNGLKVAAMVWTNSITNHKLCHTPLNELKVRWRYPQDRKNMSVMLLGENKTAPASVTGPARLVPVATQQIFSGPSVRCPFFERNLHAGCHWFQRLVLD